MAKRSGGGITSKNLVHKPVRTGERARAIRERGTSQIGQSLANHVTERRQVVNPVEKVRGELRPQGGPGGIDLGNEVAKRTVCGPGGSRTVYGSGTQSAPPAPQARPSGRDTLLEFGPDFKQRGQQ
jgi:hypothetical protein